MDSRHIFTKASHTQQHAASDTAVEARGLASARADAVWRDLAIFGLGPIAVLGGAGAVAFPKQSGLVALSALALIGVVLGGRALARWIGAGAADDRGRPVLSQAEREDVEDRIWTLNEREARLRETLDNQAEIILRRGPDGALKFVNSAFAATFGLEPRRVLGTVFRPPVLDMDRDHSAGCALEQVLTIRGPRWISWTETTIPSGDGCGADVQCVGRDVTEHRAWAQRLAEARDQAHAADRAKSRFLAAVSHELRTPMNGVVGLARLLAGTRLDPEQTLFVEGIVRSADYLGALLDDVLAFSSIDAGGLRLRIEAFEFSEVVERTLGVVRQKADQKGLVLELDMPPDVRGLAVVGDAHRLQQVLLVLLDNAVKFTDSGSVTMRVACAFEGAAMDDPGDWGAMRFAIDVLDTGPGFGGADPEALFAAFETFRRGTGTGGLDGVGLGLAIARRLTEAMGGRVEAADRADGGAVFTVSLALPLAKVGAGPEETSRGPMGPALTAGSPVLVHAAADRATANETVLVVEDNPVNALVARVTLERFGYTVDVAETGEAAVRYLAPPLTAVSREDEGGQPVARPIAVLVDLKLPDISGFEVLKRCEMAWRAHGIAPECRPPMIALTAHAFETDRQACVAAGFKAHLSKPFDPEALARLLRDCRARPAGSCGTPNSGA